MAYEFLAPPGARGPSVPLGDMALQKPADVDITGGRVVRLREFSAFRGEIIGDFSVGGDLAVEGGGSFAGSLSVAGAITAATLTLATALYLPDGTAAAPGLAFDAEKSTGIYRPGSGQIAVSLAGVEKMRLIGTGQLGIGMTPYGTDTEAAIYLAGRTALLGIAATGNTQLTNNLYRNAGGWRYQAAAAASAVTLSAGMLIINTAPVGVADAAPVLTERLRLLETGQLGLGMTPYNNSLTGGSIDLAGGAGLFGNSNNFYLSDNAYYNAGWKFKQASGAAIFVGTGSTFIWYTATSAGAVADAAMTITQRMSLNEPGYLSLGSSGAPANHNVAAPTIHWPGTGYFLMGSEGYFMSNAYLQSGTWKRIAVGYSAAFYVGSGAFYLYGSSSAGADTSITYLTRIAVDVSGNVGVGINPSGSYLLEVNGSISGTTVRSSVATGTAPFTVASTTLVTNLNADKCDGYDVAEAATASTICARNSSGYINAVYFNASNGDDSSTASHYIYMNSSDGYYRRKTLANVKTEIVTQAAIQSPLTGTFSITNVTTLALGTNCNITGNAGTLYSTSVRDSTTANAANMVIDGTGGFIQRSTSSRRYKREIEDAWFGLKELMALRPVTFKGSGKLDGEKVHGGLIAEEVYEAGLEEFVTMRDGKPDGLEYGHMVALVIAAMKEFVNENRKAA